MSAIRGKALRPTREPFPDKMRVTLTYVERFPLFINNSASATIYQYCGNDLFDPNFTGTGAQPKYYDQLSALYNRYRVYASAIECKFYNTTNASTTYVDCALAPVNQTAAGYQPEALASLPRATWTTIQANSGFRTLRNAVTTAIQLGVKDVEGSDRLQSTITQSPSERWLWAISARSYDSTTLCTIGLDVKITYDCEFFDRTIATDSLIVQPPPKPAELKELSTDSKEDGIQPGLANLKQQLDEYVVLKNKFAPPSLPPTPIRPSERKVNSMK